MFLQPSYAQQNKLAILDSLNNQAFLQLQSNQYYASLKTIEIFRFKAQEANVPLYVSKAYNITGLAYLQHYGYKKAETSFLKAIEIDIAIDSVTALAGHYANLIHLYALSKSYGKYKKAKPKAQYYSDLVNGKYQYSIYETELIRLYQQKKIDSLIETATKAVHFLETSELIHHPINHKGENQFKERLSITYNLFLAYGLMEQKVDLNKAYELLTEIDSEPLESILWYSPRVFEHRYKICYYKQRYFLLQGNLNKDSVVFYQNKADLAVEAANTLLKNSSSDNTDYVIKTITIEQDLEQLEITNRNQLTENEFIRKINYLYVFLSIIAVGFLVYFYRNLKKTRRFNAQLDAKNKELELLHEDKDNFLGVVSHEIRTPLYALQELITSDVVENDSVVNTHINYSLFNLRHVIDNAFQYSRLKYFRVKIQPTESRINLLRFIEDIFEYYSAISGINSCDFSLNIDLVNSYFLFDSYKIKLLLGNLIKNAIEESSVSSVVLSVKETVVSESTSNVEFKVIDNGKGIEDEVWVNLEQKYAEFKANVNKGMQIGLYLCKELLAMHNTKLQVDNSNGAHELFFSLVLHPCDYHSKPFSDKARTKRILYVDDNKMNLMVTKKMISKLGYHCDIIDNGEDAIQIIQEKDYGLIIMDLNMPRLNGYETSIQIKKIDKYVPIIAYTALSKDEVMISCIQASIDDVLTKPISSKEMKNTLDSYFLEE